MKPSLCLNMIVRNEGARIERCLKSVLPYVKAVAILDTGSTDDTMDIAAKLCEEAGVPFVWTLTTFKDFSQARNEAFELARTYNTGDRWCQFALLMDADMELAVTDPDALSSLDANAASYDMMQKGGAVSYANRRVVNLNCAKPPYVGVTHEYVDVDAAGMIEGASFVDHADGANRKDKFQRDAKLLEAALVEEPNNGRYLYYLGQTYADWGRPINAIGAYQQRIDLGGWDQETYMSMFNLANCWKAHENEDGFVAGMIEAYNFRPSRAEPLYELAKHYREKGQNAAALLFAKQGLSVYRPDDLLFVNDYVYSHGLRYEYSIVASYDAKEKSRAFQVTNDLALDPTCPDAFRFSARSNLFWHTKPLAGHCPSFKSQVIDLKVPEGYTAMNPSVMNALGNGLVCLVRTVNYKINEHGQYMIGPLACNDAPIDTRNFICHLDRDLTVLAQYEVIWDRPPPAWDMVTGLEDMRIFQRKDGMWFNACARETNAGGVCQQVFGKIDQGHVVQWKTMSAPITYEKNWMHWDDDKFAYRLDTFVTADGNKEKIESNLALGEISGSSQCIPFKCGKLAIVHEASTEPGTGKRTYWHRFAWFEESGRLRRLSLPFVFLDRQIEFCAGLAYHPNKNDLVISFGVRDAEAHIATVSIEEVAMMIWKFHEN